MYHYMTMNHNIVCFIFVNLNRWLVDDSEQNLNSISLRVIYFEKVSIHTTAIKSAIFKVNLSMLKRLRLN